MENSAPTKFIEKNQNNNSAVVVFQSLKHRIINWEYLPGERLTEEQICREFGLSRSPVREALRMLVENGLMDKEPNRYYKVKDLDLKLLNELYELRNVIETYAVSRAVETMPESIWQQLFDFWSLVPDNIPPEGIDLTLEDEKFHETIAASTKNNTLLQNLHSINERLHFIRMRDYSTPKRLLQTYEQHLAILKAIKDHAVSDAREVMHTHIDMAHSNVEAIATQALARAYIIRNSSKD